MSARTILLAAAEKADQRPATSGRYWHTDIHNLVYSGDRFRVVDASREEAWTGDKGRGQAVAMNVPGPADGEINQWRLVIDPRTGGALAFEMLQAKSGDRISSSLIIAAERTDRPPSG